MPLLRWKRPVLYISALLLFFPLFVFFAQPPDVSDAPRFLGETVERTGVAQTDVATAAGEAIRILLSTVGIFFFVLVLYGGFRWMTARGNEESVEKAKKAVMAASIGLVIVVGAYGFSVLVTSRLLTDIEPSGPLGTVGQDQVEVGCCFDKVERESGPLEFTAQYWTMRMTTFEDCQFRGTNPEPYDILVGPSPTFWDWEALGPDECDAKFEELLERD